MTRNEPDVSRRQFLTGRLRRKEEVVRPPWLLPANLASCDGCGDCATACEPRLISIVDETPQLSFNQSECTFCGACAESCPQDLFDRQAPAFEHVVAIGAECLAWNGIVCQSCRDACPEMAISFLPRIGGPFLPTLQPDLCCGCGACIAACPSEAISVDVQERRREDV